MITKLLDNEEMSYILSLQQIFNTFFPGCSTQLRFPTGGFVLEVNIEMIPGTWRAWEEVVGHQTQPNHIWRFICSNISFNGIVGQYKIPKKICPGRRKRGKNVITKEREISSIYFQ